MARRAPRSRQKMSPINYGLFLLGRRDYGIEELRQKFEQHYRDDIETQKDIAPTVTRFIELGYLDDQRFISGYVRREAARGQGPMKIRWALRQKNIDQSAIEMSLEEIDWYAHCLDTMESRRHRVTDIQKMTRFLAGRGFSSDQIQDSLNKWPLNSDEI